MGGRRVLRYEVPVDDSWHRIDDAGQRVGPIAARNPAVVEFWAIKRESTVQRPHQPFEYRVYGTGHLLDDDAAYVGTCLAADGALVWHLFKRQASS